MPCSSVDQVDGCSGPLYDARGSRRARPANTNNTARADVPTRRCCSHRHVRTASSNRQCTCGEPHHTRSRRRAMKLPPAFPCLLYPQHAQVRPCPGRHQFSGRVTGAVWAGRLAAAAAAAATATATFRAEAGPELETWEVEISSRSRRREGAGVVSSAAPVRAKGLEAAAARAKSLASAEDLPRSAEKQSSFGEIREILVCSVAPAASVAPASAAASAASAAAAAPAARHRQRARETTAAVSSPGSGVEARRALSRRSKPWSAELEAGDG